MAFIRRIEKRNGEVTYWVHDIRDGRYIRIAECATEAEAQIHKEQYEIRYSLEKEGYFDPIQAEIDELPPTPTDFCEDCKRLLSFKELLYIPGVKRVCKYCLKDKHGISERLFRRAKGDD